MRRRPGYNDFGVILSSHKRKWRKWRCGNGSCGHTWCSECITKRGRNIGNRRLRRRAKEEINKDLNE